MVWISKKTEGLLLVMMLSIVIFFIDGKKNDTADPMNTAPAEKETDSILNLVNEFEEDQGKFNLLPYGTSEAGRYFIPVTVLLISFYLILSLIKSSRTPRLPPPYFPPLLFTAVSKCARN